MITVRITRNIFSGDYECVRLNGTVSASDIRDMLHIPSALLFRDGKPLLDDDTISDDDFIIAQVVPKGVTAALAVLLAISIFGSIVGTVLTLSMLSEVPSAKKLQTNPSLRGSTNSARKNQMLPMLLGRHRVYPDVAALPFSVYRNNDQYLRQLFCFGYRNASIDRSTIKIGETLLSKYRDYTLAEDPEDLYSQRCIESAISLKLSNDGEPDPIERTTASNTWKIGIGIIAPSGISGEGSATADVGIRIEYRISGSGSWITAAEETLSLNTEKFRKMYEITPASPGTFDVRITRTNAESESASVIDAVYLDVMQSWTQDSEGSKAPVDGPERFSLLSLELRATDQLNGIIDELNAVCTLRARIYKGTGTGPDTWEEGDATNPAAVLLYLLTDQYANPSPLSDDEIVWDEFEAFYEFCDEHGFECNAYITSEEYSIEDICSYIAQSSLAQIRHAGRKVGITIDAAVNHYTQLFTPRNAWDFSVQRSFSQDIRYFRIKYVDESLGYEETERTVSLDAQGNIVFDAEIPEDESGTEISLVGVTDPEHAAYVGRQRLRAISRQKRTFSWTSDIEGILCVPGDVVLLEHSQFSIGLGEGRIKRIIRNENGIINGIELDSAMPFESSKVYSVIIRSGSAISASIPIGSYSEDGKAIFFSTPPQNTISTGDLCAIGELSKETIPVQITEIERDENSNCRVTAVDYDPAIYEEGEIPPYDPGISRYPDAGDIGTGAHLPDGYVPPSLPGSDGGDPMSLFQYSASPIVPPDESSSLIVWGGTVIAWGSSAFSLNLGEWTPEIPATPPEGKPYLWEKYWSYTLNKWQIFCRMSAPAPDFTVSFVPQTYRMTSRGITKGENTIRAICRKRNTTAPAVWTAAEAVSLSYPAEGQTDTVDITIPEGIELASFQISCYVESVDTKTYEISGVPEGNKEPLYLGIYESTAPLPGSTAEGDLIAGDHLMIENEDGSRDPYYWNGTAWVISDGNMPVSFGFKVLQDSLWDAANAPGSSTTLSAFNIFAANMGTNLLFSYYAKIRNLLVGDGSPFSFEVFDYKNGKKVTPVIRAKFNGKVIFQIVPTSGKVFFGEPDTNTDSPISGFVYDPADADYGACIKSRNKNVIITEDGRLIADNASIRGAIDATEGSFKGHIEATSGLFKGEIETPAFSSEYGTTGNVEISSSEISKEMGFDLYTKLHDNGLPENTYLRCKINNLPETYYIQYQLESGVGTVGSGNSIYRWMIRFYNADYEQIEPASIADVTGSVETYGYPLPPSMQVIYYWEWIPVSPLVGSVRTGGIYFTSPVTLEVETGGEGVVLFKDTLPMSDVGLQKGQLYCENGFLKIVL